MSQPYYCKVCEAYDEEGIGGHDASRCKPPAPVNLSVVNAEEPVNAAVNEPKKKRSKDRHKKRLEYQKIKQREYRARQKALKGSK